MRVTLLRLGIACSMLLLCAAHVFAATTHGLRSEARERAAWFADTLSAHSTSACSPVVPVSSLTFATFACEGYVHDGTEMHFVTQATSTVGPLSGGNGTYWLAIHKDRSGAVGGWTRHGITHYLWQLSATLPATPTNGLIFAKVTVAGAVITAVENIEARIIAATETVATNRTWSGPTRIVPSALLSVSGGATLTINCAQLTAPSVTIFTGAGTVLCSHAPPSGIPAAWFGVATGASEADNTTALAAALAAVPTDDGATFLDAGTYAIDSFTIPTGTALRLSSGAHLDVDGSITLSTASKLLCADRDHSIITETSGTTTPLLLGTTGATDVHIRGCDFVGEGLSADVGLEVQNPIRWRIESNIFENFHCTAIWIKEDSAFNVLAHNFFRLNRFNVTEASCPSATDVEVYFDRTATATKIAHHRGNIIEGNLSIGTAGEEIRNYIFESFNDGRIVNNTIEDGVKNGFVLSAGASDALSSSDNNVVSGNTCRDFQEGGSARCIFLFNSANHNTITNNTMINIEGDCIHATNSGYNIIANNILQDCGTEADTPLTIGGIRLDGIVEPQTQNVIKGNVITNGGAYGIVVAGNITSTIIDNNTIIGAGVVWTTSGRGIWLSGLTASGSARRSLVTNNVVVQSAGHGVFVEGDATSSVIIDNFIIDSSQDTDNTYDGIHLTTNGAFAPSSITIRGNRIMTAGAANTHRYGVNVGSVNLQAHVLDNNVSGTGTASYNMADTNNIVRWTDEPNSIAMRVTDGTSTLMNLDTAGNLSSAASWQPGTTTFSALGVPSDGFMVYCSDCTPNVAPCTGSGTGAIAKRLNSAWDCR